jgi:hypothetical protein
MEIKDLVGMSEPATKLIELVGKASGVLYEPTRIVREAKAQAVASVIKAQAEIETEAIRARAAARLIAQEIKKQENLEAVTRNAAALVSSSPADEQTVDEDWINRFVLEAQEVSDKRLQTVWAKLLAGEFQAPGTYPRRVFRVLKDLEPWEAELIDSLAGKLLWVENADKTSTPFLNSHIFEEWASDAGTRRLLGTTPVENAALLRELGVIDEQDYSFAFSVEGPISPDRIHISSLSASRIYSEELELVPEHIQPGLVRTEGPLFTAQGIPRLTGQLKIIEFDAWKITSLGVNLFKLSGRKPEAEHLAAIRKWLTEAGVALKN